MKKSLVAAFCFLVTLASAQTDYTQVYNSKKAIAEGTDLHDSEKFEEAIKKFATVDLYDPEYPTAQYEKAVSLIAAKKTDSVYAVFESYYKQDLMKKLPTLFTLQGSFLSDEKKYAESEKVFLEGLKYIPNSTNHLYNLAILYYRAEKLQLCIETLQKIIAANPNALNAHYLLGLIALENGRITEGTMALLGYLMLAPEGKHATNSVLQLNKKFGENYLEKTNYVFSKTGDNFEEIETILKNQLPLRNAYKIYSKIDDVVIRQVQAVIEYSQTHKMANGFFETTYVPWLKSIADQKQIENFSYYILQSLREGLGKSLTSQNKKLQQFSDTYVDKDFWKYFGTRKMDFYGEEKEVTVYLKNSIPNLIGTVTNEKKEGKFKLLNKYENLYGELQFSNNELNGVQKYYNEDGNLIEEKSFLNGEVDGKRTTYSALGVITAEENYKNGLLEGKTIIYYINGGKDCEYNLAAGELDGASTCYYNDGTKKKEFQYLAGKINGAYTTYNVLGEIESTQSYINGELNGAYKKYYDSKTTDSEAMYEAGKVIGTYKSYYPSGVLKEEYIYKDKKLNKHIEYRATGVKSSESLYTDKGDLETTIHFDAFGDKYYEEVFNSKEIKYIRQYARNNPKPTEINLARKGFEIKNLDNKTLITGAFEKGRRHGNWNYYFANGLPSMEMTYNKGAQEGLYKLYTKYGLLYSISNYVNDTVSGRSDRLDSRGLKNTYYYNGGERNGPYISYYSSGKIENKEFYIDGDLEGMRKTYSENGQELFIDYYDSSVSTSFDIIDAKGLPSTKITFTNKTGKIQYGLFSNTTLVEYDVVNGQISGKYIKKDKFNKPLIEADYRNGALINTYKNYGPLDVLLTEYHYNCGRLHGKTTNYDLAGKVKQMSNYLFGDEYGLTTRYFYNGTKAFEYSQLDDIYEGDYTYYNQKGEALLTIHYVDNIARYYLKKSKTGELTEKVVIDDETATFTSNYASGKMAISFKMDKGSKQGDFTINSEAGKPEYTASYKNDLLDGERIQYYSNGNVYCKERFVVNDYEGIQEYYKEDGKPWIKASYKNDELHGKTEIFTNGILTQTKNYDSDFLVEISK